MRYAIATDGEQVWAHFGRCSQYLLVDIDDGEVVDRLFVDNPGHEPGLLPRFLHQYGVDCVVAGGAGQRAVNLLGELGISLYVGVEGPIDEVVEGLRTGELATGESTCEH